MWSSFSPSAVASTWPSSCQRVRHFSTRADATISRPRGVSTRLYSSSGLTLSAWLAGIVQAVVVQMTMKASLSSRSRPKAAASRAGSAAGNITSSVWLCLSWYSISNSASDEAQSKHQYTGFKPRYTKPRSITFLRARNCPASLAKFMVLYGLSHSPSTPKRWKSSSCCAICSVAKARPRACISSRGRLRPCFFSMAFSIGRPWQSQPGVYSASNPSSWRALTIMSLRILLTAWPMWIWPLAYGGPSCRMNLGAPRRASRSCL